MTTRACLICGAPLGLFAPASDVLCHQVKCAWTYRSTPPDQRCLICTRPLTTPEAAGRLCGEQDCRIRYQEVQRATARKELELAAEALARQLTADVNGDERHAPRIFIPSFDGRMARAGRKRSRALRAHLEEIVAASHDVLAAQPPAERTEPVAPAMAQALGAACTTCRGHCCRHGGTHAYLVAETIAGYRAAHPGISDAKVVQHYLDQLPQSSCSHSCVYHSARGCTLPRAMRSSTCNAFYCGALKDFRDSHGTRPLPVLFLASDQNRVERATLVTAERVRSAKRSKAPARTPIPPPATLNPV